MYKIVTTPSPTLVKKAGKVKHFDKKLHGILHEMAETLKNTSDPVGVGLAAPQVGLSLAIFQMRPKDEGPITSIINPEIVSESLEEVIPSHINSAKVEKKKPKKGRLLEGCLSIPNIWGHVARKKEVTVRWQNDKGHTQQKRFIGFPAVIVQHEMDHLNGILFTKHVIAQKEKLYKSHKDAEGVEVFDEIKI